MTSKRRQGFVILDDDVLQRMAYILGPQSAAAKALADCREKRENGSDAVVGSTGNMLVVCSRSFAEMRQDRG